LINFLPIEETLTRRMGNIRKEAVTKSGEKLGKKRLIPVMRTASTNLRPTRIGGLHEKHQKEAGDFAGNGTYRIHGAAR